MRFCIWMNSRTAAFIIRRLSERETRNVSARKSRARTIFAIRNFYSRTDVYVRVVVTEPRHRSRARSDKKGA